METKKNPLHDVHKQRAQFFFIGLSLALALIITAFEWKSEETAPTVLHPYDESTLTTYTPAVIPEPRLEIPEPTKVKPVVKHVRVTDDTPEAEASDQEYLPSEPNLTENYPVIDIIEVPEKAEDFVVFAEEMPQPFSGYEGLYQELSQKIKYPSRARREHIEGKVFVEFVVNESGKLERLKIVKGIGYGCDEEALRALATTQWRPGKQRGIPVKVRMILPVQFRLQ